MVDPYSIDALLERHDREFAAFRALTEPEKSRQQLRMHRYYAQNTWAFMSDCMYTLDPVSKAHPIKPFPGSLEYLEFITGVWLSDNKLAIPKSRRMFCSWNFIGCYTHDTIFHTGRHNAFVSKKEDDSADLVSRAEFIYHRIPEWRIPRELLPKIKNGKMSKQPPLLEFEELNSKIQGFPQGADQLRQFTLSGALLDEWAFWDQAQAAYSALKPTLDGGGRITGISSRATGSSGFFKKIVFDKLNAQDLIFREVPPVTAKRPMEGIEVWRNPENGFTVIELHYTADPRKRGTAWRDAIRKEMPIRDYLMEYERSWQTFEGRPVYADFNKALHVSTTPIEIEPGVPLFLGWDFGLTPACILAQPAGRQLKLVREFIEESGSISKLAPVVWAWLEAHYPAWTARPDDMLRSFIDPAGFQRAQTDARTCAGVLREFGFTKVQPGPVDWESRRKAVEDCLTKTYGEGPALLIDEAGCPITVEGFAGGYRYPDKAGEIEPALIRPIKNKYSHPHDGLQYLAAGAATLRKQYGLNIPTPGYGFQSA